MMRDLKLVCTLCALPYCLIAQTPNAAQTPHTAHRMVSAPAGTARTHGPAFVPMTEAERLRECLKNVTSPASVLGAAASAGIGQWRNSPEQWGQGAEGYGRRFGSAYAQNIVRQTLIFGASSVLHEDDRYFRLGQSGFKARIWYAVRSTFLARRDDGTSRFSYSRIGGIAGASFISRLWQPATTGGIENAAANIGTSIAATAGFNLAREFLPDIWHRR